MVIIVLLMKEDFDYFSCELNFEEYININKSGDSSYSKFNTKCLILIKAESIKRLNLHKAFYALFGTNKHPEL